MKLPCHINTGVVYSTVHFWVNETIPVINIDQFIMLHTLNILVHVVAGSLALILGALTIYFNRRAGTHKKLGTCFLYFMGIVVMTGFVGWLFFRSDPFLLILVIISGYEAFAGFRVVILRERPPQLIDLMVPVLSLGVSVIFLLKLSYTTPVMSSSVIISTMVGLVIVTGYDIAKYFFIHPIVKTWWLYEHIYKMIGGFSAILSAFTATVITVGKPYTQLGPAVICFSMIFYFIIKRAGEARRKTRLSAEITGKYVPG